MSDETFTTIHPVEIARIPALQAKALEDAHALFSPTDIIVKNGEVIGALEICSTPVVFMWMHTQKARIRDSICAWQYAENIARRTGAKHVLFPVPKTSPFYTIIRKPSLGYVELPNTVVFMKQLRT